MKRLVFLFLLIGLNLNAGLSQSDPGQNCFTILVGKEASADGSVFVAHNEDDLNDHNFVDLHKVPRVHHQAGERQVFLGKTDSIDEVGETFAYFWITGSKYAEEQYVNEWGVAITSNSSQSRVLNGNGKIDHNLRRLVIERSRTAREAVHIAGGIVEEFGYASSGRVYSIADPYEAWVFEVANGKHWVARRVPDGEVAIVPNYYVIDDFHPADTSQYLAAPDLIAYAVHQGWYDPQRDTSFNFRKVYGHTNRLDATWNIARKWVILNQFSPQQYDYNADFPFSIRPKTKIDMQMLMDALANHYEKTVFAQGSLTDRGSTHRRSGLGVKDTMTVCNFYNDYACITQLRSWLPSGIGNVIWIAPRYPCLQPFIPWYYGMDAISSDYEKATYQEALENYNNKNRDYFHLYPGHACWIFDDFANTADSCTSRERESIREWKKSFQADVMGTVNAREPEILRLFASDPGRALRELSALSNGLAEKALKETKGQLLRLSRSREE